jgi:hypothetical protein
MFPFHPVKEQKIVLVIDQQVIQRLAQQHHLADTLFLC